jgi:hypothetical protein
LELREPFVAPKTLRSVCGNPRLWVVVAPVDPAVLVPGNAAYEELRERENREQREREIASENESYRLAYEQSPEGRARREMLALVDERVTDRVNAILDDRVEVLVEKHFDEMRSELEPTALKGLRAKWDAATGGAEG